MSLLTCNQTTSLFYSRPLMALQLRAKASLYNGLQPTRSGLLPPLWPHGSPFCSSHDGLHADPWAFKAGGSPKTFAIKVLPPGLSPSFPSSFCSNVPGEPVNVPTSPHALFLSPECYFSLHQTYHIFMSKFWMWPFAWPPTSRTWAPTSAGTVSVLFATSFLLPDI